MYTQKLLMFLYINYKFSVSSTVANLIFMPKYYIKIYFLKVNDSAKSTNFE